MKSESYRKKFVFKLKKILDWLGIDELRRDVPPPKRLAVADSFDDYGQNDYVDFNY